jgi:large subunit ribosomal protein L32
MPTPKKKVSHSRRNMRRAHDALSPLHLSQCPHCAAPKLSHCVCESCGFYKGRFVAKRFLKADLLSVLRS